MNVAKREQTYNNGQIIFRKGDESDRAFEVISGAVELLAGDGKEEKRVGVARAGEMFGESGLIGGGERENTARAVGNVVARVIVHGTSSYESSARGSNTGILNGLMERISGKKRTPTSIELIASDSTGAPSSIFKRMIDSVNPLEGRIEICLASLIGDENGAQAEQIVTALMRFRDVRIRLIDDEFALNLQNSFRGELISFRRLLKAHDADLMIWGRVPSTGTGPELHFLARGDWDERLPGAFSPSTNLLLPSLMNDAAADLLHAVIIAATRPKRGEQEALRKITLPGAAKTAIFAADELTLGFGLRERAATQLCLGNIFSALWAQDRNMDHLYQANKAYQRVISLLAGEATAMDSAFAHKHISAISIIRAEEDGERIHYDEAAANAMAALEEITVENHPVDWASLNFRLGAINYKLGFESGDTDVLRRSLRYHRQALRGYSRKHTPDRWAEAMSAFGQAAQVFGELVKSLDALATAVNACRAVVEVRDQQKTPLAWAAAQNNLGSALFLLGKKARNPERIQLAISAFESALLVYQKRKLFRLQEVIEKNLERAQDTIAWYSPDGIPIVDMVDPLANQFPASKVSISSGEVIKVVE